MVEPIARHREASAGSSTERWVMLGCELLTLAALVASLVSMAPVAVRHRLSCTAISCTGDRCSCGVGTAR